MIATELRIARRIPTRVGAGLDRGESADIGTPDIVRIADGRIGHLYGGESTD